jgi:hypothetical protein
MRKTRKNMQNVKWRRHKCRLTIVLLALLPGLVSAYEVYVPSKDYPCLCDTMPASDLCETQVRGAYTIWLSQRGGVFHKTYTSQPEFNEAMYIPALEEGSVSWVLTKLASDLAWAGKDLRQVEEAVLKKCRTWPDEALRNFTHNYGLK